MSTQEPNIPYSGETTAERLRGLALSADARERLSALATRYWEAAAYGVLLLTAVVMRFYNLGARGMHHDESLHSFFAYGFKKGLSQALTFGTANHDNYKHVPFMHGPFQFIGNGFVMWIFQDGDYQARILAATMGTAIVAAPLLFRQQLGRYGALAAAAFLCISPTLMYYSRFTREDIYTAFWTLGMVIFAWRYMATRKEHFLFLLAGFMAMSFATKETTFMTVATFIFFFNYLFAEYLSDRIRAKTPDMPQYSYIGLRVALTIVPVPILIAIGWPLLTDLRRRYDMDDDQPPEASILAVMSTLALPQFAASVQLLPGFGDTWRNRAGENSDSHVASQETTVAVMSVVMLIGVSTVLGLLWKPRVWLIAAACFWIPFVLLYTTFFTNPPGFMSGIWGSLDYWLSQQDVRRGDQPDYYYFITIPVYEFLTLALSLAAIAYYTIRGKLTHALIMGGLVLAIIFLLALPSGPEFLKCQAVEGCGSHKDQGISLFHVIGPFGLVILAILVFPMDRFTRFLLYWLVTTALALTIAGEKMPWLNVHIALPLAIIAGKFVGDILERTDLRADLPPLERLAPFAYAAIASALAVLVFVLAGPASLPSVGGWILVVVAAVSVYWAYTGYSAMTAMQVAFLGAVAAFAVFTFRAGVLASWGHPETPRETMDGRPIQALDTGLADRDYGDVPVEMLVYTQTSGDIPALRDLIDKAARDSGKGRDLPIVVDPSDGFTWPWAWYLRDYKQVNYQTPSAGYKPPDGAVLLISKNNVANVQLGDNYSEGKTYHHRRWFPEDYRSAHHTVAPGEKDAYTTHDFFSDLVDVGQLGRWLDYWVRRNPPSELGTVDGVAYFPKDYGAIIPDVPVGPTVRTEGTQLVIGGSGSAKGQLAQPADVAFDAQGNIYVADTNNNRVQKYDPQGNFLASVGTDAGLNQPWSLTVAPDGSVFVANTWAHNIVKLNSDLTKAAQWGEPCTTLPNCDELQLFGPRDIKLTPDGHLLVSDTGNGRIIEYDQDGKPVRTIGAKGTSGDPLQFNEPVGIAVAPNGDIYIADFWNKRIVHLNKDLQPQGTPIAVDTWGSTAVTDRPYLALLPDGRLLATDPSSGKVLTFSAQGQKTGEYTLPTEAAQPAARPIGITLSPDGQSLLVSDGAGSVVRKIPLAEVAK